MTNRLLALTFFLTSSTPAYAQTDATPPRLTLHKGDHVCLVGNTLAERLQYFGHVETLLHANFPQHELVVRNLGFSADEVKLRSRLANFGEPDQHLTHSRADVVLAFFGFNESFAGDEGLPQFEADLREFIQHTLTQKYNGKTPPRLALFSPIAHENLGNPNLADGTENNARLAKYTQALAKIAAEQKVPFVDLFTVSRDLMSRSKTKLTINGIHLSEAGEKLFAPALLKSAFGVEPKVPEPAAYERLRAEVNEKNYQWFHRYRAVNGYYIYAERNRVWNNEAVMDTERRRLDEMTAIRDRRVWAVAQGKPVPAAIDDSGITAELKVESNYKEPIRIVPPEEAIKMFHVAEGYAVNLFASEVEFPDLKKPVQFTFDAKGRLWVAVMPSYPGYQPPEKPNDKLIILEDTDGDGRADKQTVFADGLHVPTGFEFGDGGVYLAQQPNLMFLKDNDGDDKADERHLIMHGFDTGDTHHAISMFTWGPGGGLFLCEGTFHHSSVESPYGPVRNAHGGIYRYEPRTQKFDTWIHYNFANPWGLYFDRWGQPFVADASPGANYWGTPLSVKSPQFTGQEDFGPFKFKYRSQMEQWFPKRVRPTCGCELISSRHFPPEAQGNYLLNNVIGFQGILQHTVKEEGAGFVGKEIEPLLYSSDRNFRPTGLQFGPDGALYVVDWYNPLIGHLQHSIRDPNRDHTHGRIWRVTFPSRALVTPPKIAGQPIPALLELLKTYEDRTRYAVRRELRQYPTAEVVAAVDKWVAGLNASEPDHEHLLLEALWVKQHHNVVDENLLRRLLRANDFHARAAATCVLADVHARVADALSLFRAQVNDEHPRVRVEAVRACSFVEDQQAAEIALEVLRHPMEYYLTYTLGETIRALEPHWKPTIVSGRPFAANNPQGLQYIIASVSNEDLAVMSRSQPVFDELLTRHGIAPRFRQEALEGLATLHSTDVMTELLGVIEQFDKSPGSHGEHVLADLTGVLATQPAEQIAKNRARLESFARTGSQPVTRRLAFAALVANDKSADKIWPEATKSMATLRDFLEAVPMIPDDAVRARLLARVEPLLHGLPPSLADETKRSPGLSGRFVRIELPGKSRVLTLAEVEVISGGKNIAREGRARQISTNFAGQAPKAIDGNKSGTYGDGGQTHTAAADNPWWELDLRGVYPIESIALWNRSENNGQYADRLNGYTLTILDAQRKPVFERKQQPAPRESVQFTVSPNPAETIRRAAIDAVTALPGHEAKAFSTLARFVRENVSRSAAVSALGRIPRGKIPAAEVRPLIDSLVAYVQTVPVAERTQTEVAEAVRLGKDLTAVLPQDEGRALFMKLRELGVDVFVIRPIRDRMEFDRKQLFVEAGKPFEIIFDNIDIMPHNLVVTAQGAREEIGILAEKMGATPEGMARHFVPSSPKVLAATTMLQTGQQQRLQIVAPTQTGEYPFVCTFPGHWRTMYGTIHVVKDVSEIPLEPTETPIEQPVIVARAFVRKWQVADLAGALAELDKGRSHESGRKLFLSLACATCHQIRGEGGKVGPDLTEVSKKLAEGKLNRAGLLTEMIEPSKVIAEQFRTQIILTDKGTLASGVVVFENDTLVRLMANPLDKEAKPQEIVKQNIEERTASATSVMPEGLLNTLTRDEILDLLSYIVTAGEPGHKHH